MAKITKITMYETDWCGDCRRAKIYFEQNRIENVEHINIERDPKAAKTVEKLNNGSQSVPTIIVDFDDGTRHHLTEPSWDELEEVFGG